MARINLTKIGGAENETPIDKFLKSLGGCTYTNMYTHGADTPRSLACFQTGLEPQYNGCDTRIKWPRYFAKQDVPSIFDIFNRNDFEQFICVKESTVETGAFLDRTVEHATLTSDLGEFSASVKESLLSNRNTLAHLHLQDYHWSIDDFGANKLGVLNGQTNLCEVTEKFFKLVGGKDKFDCIVVFSDHGHKLDSEVYSQEKLLLLNDDRANILFHVYHKGDKHHHLNNELHSICDLYQGVANYVESKKDYLSLLKREYIIIEDHDSFAPDPSLPIKLWRIVTPDVSVYSDAYKYYKNDNKGMLVPIDNTEYSKVIDTLANNSDSFYEMTKRVNILDSYKKLSDGDFFTHGKKRPKRFYKLLGKLRRLPFKIKSKI